MTTTRSVYPSAVADKCVEMLCEWHPYLQDRVSFLNEAQYLMMHGYVERQKSQSRKSIRFVVLSPDTPQFYYAVDLRDETCTCADFLRYQRPCGHICAVVLTLLAQRRLYLVPQTKQRKAGAK